MRDADSGVVFGQLSAELELKTGWHRWKLSK